jgi:ATP-dependent Clp protease ATP-binding subunit ClpC
MAREIFGQKDALLQLEMSDFADAHAISRLVGSPPGYVGYHDEDALVTPLRRSPSRLVLLQDFNRAHPRVQDRIFRMFEEGEVADTRGLKADVSHAIFVLTVEQEAVGAASIGFGRATTPTGDDVLRRTDPDLAQRLRGREIDVIRFDGLRDDDGDLAEKLVRRRLAEFRAALGEAYDVELVIAAPIEDDLLGRVRALDDARGIDAVLRELIIAPVTAQLLAGGSGTTLTLGTLPMRPLTSTESAAYPSASTTRPPEDDPAEKEHV